MSFNLQDISVSSIIKDYLNKEDNLKDFYDLFPNRENYIKQAKQKLKQYDNRATLNLVLNEQMQKLKLYSKQKEHLSALQKNKTVTVTTGHQLNLLTGPLYFIYKILNTVKICDELNDFQNEIHFVPIYWMATEDHDFEEISHFYSYNKKYSTEGENRSAVGGISVNVFESALNEFIEDLPENKFGNELKNLIETHFFSNKSLAEATANFVHELIGKFGILILDADDNRLKKLMIPHFTKELLSDDNQKLINNTNNKLSTYKTQAFAREINIFYLSENKRERIEKLNDGYNLVYSNQFFTKTEILEELNNKPEKFSPNVILRPLYQEIILPNVAYIGGGGEIAYWLQLKDMFKYNKVDFPMLIVRNSALLITNTIKHKLEHFNLLSQDIFKPKEKIIKNWINKKSKLTEELLKLEQELISNFDKLKLISNQTDKSFENMLNAQRQKQINGYKKLYKRLLKAEKIKYNQQLKKLEQTLDYVFPNGNWQERRINFTVFYENYGDYLFDIIYDYIPAFESKFNIISLDFKE